MGYVNIYAEPECVRECKTKGWSIVCAASKNPIDKEEGVLWAAIVDGDVTKNARKALDRGADLVIADARSEKSCRLASESWEVDLIVNAELTPEHDKVKHKSSGIDHVIAAYMAERGTGYAINCENIAASKARNRTKTIARIMQNIGLARKYGFPVALATGNLTRTPEDVISLGYLLGLDYTKSKAAITKNPEQFIQRSENRNSPDVLLDGLQVIDWGGQERKPKRKYGWY